MTIDTFTLPNGSQDRNRYHEVPTEEPAETIATDARGVPGR
ncbi:MAG: hypothetical protein ACOCSN_02615 [Halanaeroarchaeum sp.]